MPTPETGPAAAALTPAQQALVEQHLPVVRSIVGAMAASFPAHADRDELQQAGTLGLVEAALRYDASREVPFERWAALRVRGAVLDAARALDPATRATRGAGRELTAARDALRAELGREPRHGELADRLGCTMAELVALEGRLHRGVLLSLDAPAGGADDEPLTLGLSVADDHGRQPDQVVERRESTSYLRDAVACLPDRLQDVVVGYFLQGETSADLAARLGITESRVSQLRSEGLALMRAGLTAAGAAPARAAEAAPGQRTTARQLAYDTALRQRSTYTQRLSRAV